MKKLTFFKKAHDSKPSGGKPKKKFSIKKFLLTILLVILACGLIGGVGSLIYIKHCINEAPTFNVSDFENVESTKIFDVDGELIADIGLVSRENVNYDEMPQTLVDAFLAVEDSRFFEHNGFDLPRFVKSMIENIKTLSFSQGASTFTMQLVRNVYFTSDETQTSRTKSIEYKIQQIYLAIKAEEQISKKRLFELYINRINFGASTTRGIKGAAQYYFGKDVSELTLSESAYLAGVINAPNAYNAYMHIERATLRRNTVLDLMVRHGYISKEECALAKSIRLQDQLVGVKSSGDQYMAYVNEVVKEVIAMTGKDPYVSTMNIYTYMDRKVQDTIEAIEKGEASVVWPDELMQVAIVSINNQTGAIAGIGSGRTDVVAKGFSRATDMYKQPGSAVKPFLSYALAFEYLGWATTHTLLDKPIAYRGTGIQLKNFDGTYKGEVLLDYAVGVSLNIPAYSTLEAVSDVIGSKKIVSYLNALGFNQVTNENFDLGYAIGGSTFEVTVEQMAAAHGTMVNGGNYVTPHTVSRIEFTDGSDPYVPSYASVNVISKESAYLATKLMEEDVSGDYRNYMQILRRKYEVYAKTGTTNYDDTFVKFGIPNGAAKDKWMIASTSKYTTAVWIGYDSAVDGEDTFISSKKSAQNIPGKINSLILDTLVKNGTPDNVQRPDGIVDMTHVKGVYPYAYPIEGMNPDLIVTGLINRKNMNLVPLTVPSIDALSSFTAVIKEVKDGKLTLTLNWATYPNPSQLYLSDGVLDISTDITDPKTGKVKHVEAFGRKLYDPTWVFGVIKYKARLSTSQEIIVSDNSQMDITIDVPTDGLNACGFYAYQQGDGKSNELCQPINIEVSVPDATKMTTVKDVRDFMTNYSISDTVWKLTELSVDDSVDVSMSGKIKSMTPDIRGTNVSLGDLHHNIVTIEYYPDFVLVPMLATKGDAEAFQSKYMINNGIWTYVPLPQTSAEESVGTVESVSPSDPSNKKLTLSSLRTTARTFRYFVDASVTLPTGTLGDIRTLTRYGLVIDNNADLAGLPDTTKLLSIKTRSGTVYSSSGVYKFYQLYPSVTIEIVGS